MDYLYQYISAFYGLALCPSTNRNKRQIHRHVLDELFLLSSTPLSFVFFIRKSVIRHIAPPKFCRQPDNLLDANNGVS